MELNHFLLLVRETYYHYTNPLYLYGGEDGIRTHNLYIASVAFSPIRTTSPYFGTGEGTWPLTVLLPQDFKSCVSAYSTTPAYFFGEGKRIRTVTHRLEVCDATNYTIPSLILLYREHYCGTRKPKSRIFQTSTCCCPTVPLRVTRLITTLLFFSCLACHYISKLI